MLSIPMPFASCTCRIWLRHLVGEDAYGNATPTYSEQPDITTRCVYAPGWQRQDTSDEFDDGQPYLVRTALTVYLPKSLSADMRGALVEVRPADDRALWGRRFSVVGDPISYPRANTPGDYSWAVEAVSFDG